MELVGPTVDAVIECERVLRSLPAWFGIESSLIEYARSTKQLPTFLAVSNGEVVGFVSVRRHFAQAWELHCIAVAASHRREGVGRALLSRAEAWLQGQDARVLQVKTIAESHPSAEYAETRQFYAQVGFEPLEVFPTLWDPGLPVLQLLKPLHRR